MPNARYTLFSDLKPSKQTENHLTRATGAILKRHEGAASDWISLMTGGAVKRFRPDSMKIQFSEDAGGRRHQYDMLISDEGKTFRLIVEHKVECAINHEQLVKYARALQNTELDKNGKRFLALVCASDREKRKFEKLVRPQVEAFDVRFNAFTWIDIYPCFANHAKGRETRENLLVKEFAAFLDSFGFGPTGPLKPSHITRFHQSEQHANEALAILMSYLRTLAEDEWNEVPARYDHRDVRNGYGAAKLLWLQSTDQPKQFEWCPALSMGFYYDHVSHGDRRNGPDDNYGDRHRLDLYFRIQCDQRTNPRPVAALERLKKAQERLRTRFPNARVDVRDLDLVGVKRVLDPQTLMQVQMSLKEVLGDREEKKDQLKAIRSQFSRWCKCIFEDNDLETELKKLNDYRS